MTVNSEDIFLPTRSVTLQSGLQELRLNLPPPDGSSSYQIPLDDKHEGTLHKICLIYYDSSKSKPLDQSLTICMKSGWEK